MPPAESKTISGYSSRAHCRKASVLLLSAGMFVLVAGYNVYQDGSQYRTGFYLLFLLAGLAYLLTDLKTSVRIMKAPLARVAAIFFLTIAMAQMYPGIEADSSSELVKILLILLSVLIIAQYAAANAALFSKIIMAGVVAVALVAIYHLYTFYIVDSHSVSDRMKGYFIPENPLYLAQSFGFFFIAAVYLAVENYRRPVTLVLMGLSACILAFAAMATQSRSFVVATIAAIILPFAGSGRKPAVIIFSSLLIIFAVIIYLNPAILDRTENLRPEIWRQALAIISERPFLGWGGDYYPEIRIEGVRWVLHDPHNILLTIWLKYGVLSFLALTVLLCYAVSITLGNKDNALLRMGGALLIFGVTMLFFEGHNIISRPNSTWHMVWIPLGIILGGMQQRYHDSASGKVAA